jgi:recombination protein RecA
MGEKIIGNRVKVKIVKNKVAAPFRTTEFDIMYNEGISVPGDLLDAGVELGVVNKSGNSYSFGGEKLGVGRENAKLALKERPALMKEMREKAIATWQEREQSGLSTTKADASEDESEEAPPAE